MKKSILQLLNEPQPIVADGAMATSLYERGFYINRSFEELSLTDPQAIRDTTRGFKNAGAQFFHTNTYGCTRPKLTQYGLQDQLAQIVKSSTRIAAEVASDSGYVLGLLGPLGVLVEPLGPTSYAEAEDFYFELAQIFESENVDAFAINSLHDMNEIKCAIRAVRRVSKKPVFVNIGLHENLKTAYGHSLQEFCLLAEENQIDAVGICGEIGPSTTLTAIESLRKYTNKPIIALPNAGLPRYVNDQYIYLCNPDYMGKYAKRFIEAGAKVIGGHSGVYETHIRAVANAARMAQNQMPTAVKDRELPPAIKPAVEKPTDPTPLEKRSKLGQYLKEKKQVISIELVPPALQDFTKFIERCAELQKGKVEFVNIPDGARAMARISSIHLAAMVLQKYDLEPIPHFTCRDRNLIGLQSDLLGAHISGVRNLLLVTGDPPKLGNNPGASAVYDVDAIGLTHIVSRMNRSLDIGGAAMKSHTDFTVGVAMNPTARNIELEVERIKYKVEAGCDFAITQPIYNLDTYKRFMDAAGKLNIPIIMGIWPLVSLRNAEFLKYEVPGVDVPDDIIEEMRKAGDSKEEAIKRGMEIAYRTMDAAKNIVAGFQVSAPFNKAEIAIEVVNNLR